MTGEKENVSSARNLSMYGHFHLNSGQYIQRAFLKGKKSFMKSKFERASSKWTERGRETFFSSVRIYFWMRVPRSRRCSGTCGVPLLGCVSWKPTRLTNYAGGEVEKRERERGRERERERGRERERDKSSPRKEDLSSVQQGPFLLPWKFCIIECKKP